MYLLVPTSMFPLRGLGTTCATGAPCTHTDPVPCIGGSGTTLHNMGEAARTGAPGSNQAVPDGAYPWFQYSHRRLSCRWRTASPANSHHAARTCVSAQVNTDPPLASGSHPPHNTTSYDYSTVRCRTPPTLPRGRYS